jgi:hypothetical protein
VAHAALYDNFAVARYENDSFQFSSPNYAVGENGGFATITVQRVGGLTGTVSVGVSATAGTATPGQDFTPVQMTLQFAQGETSKTVTVPVAADPYREGNESVSLQLSSPSSLASLGQVRQATLTIVDQMPTPAVNATPLVQVTAGKAKYNPATGLYRQRVLIHNPGGQALWGPLTLLLDGLHRKIRLGRRKGSRGLEMLSRSAGRLNTDVLGAGETREVVLEFKNPQNRKIRYTPRLLIGL